MALDNFKNRRFVRGDHARDDYAQMSMEDLHNLHNVGGGNMMFKEVEFPLTYDQRTHIFR